MVAKISSFFGIMQNPCIFFLKKTAKIAAHCERFEAGRKDFFNKLVTNTKYKDIRYGIKLCYKNIRFQREILHLALFRNIPAETLD